MAIRQQQQQQIQYSSLLLDALYCEEEEQWEEEELGEAESSEEERDTNPSLLPLMLSEQDLFWEDEELISLFSKEQGIFSLSLGNIETEDSALYYAARKEAVEWVLKVNAHYGFTALTAILAINYLDRFLSTSLHFQSDKPWMIQLAAVTCLSVAAKVEETQVPLLVDLQVEDAKYVFEAKTIQRMEVLVLSSLQWRMNPVTPISFFDHIVRRLGLKTHLHWDFLRRCERLLLSVISDSRFVGFLPSVLATATMLHVIHRVEPCNAVDYQNQLLGVLKLSREKVNDCYQLIVELSSTTACFNGQNNNPHKRKYHHQIIPSSPGGGVIDAQYFSSDSSNESWAVGSSVSSPSSTSPEPPFKKNRAQEQPMRVHSSLTRVFVEFVGSPH